MTETLIPIKQSSGIRLRCHCGAEATVPIPSMNVPISCFNCNGAWPDKTVRELSRILDWVKEGKDGAVSVELVLIGKPD